ncbi:MAG: hypothetical protein IPK19_30480 [Chloroflexi bacterium]|nr:hypothetical protein [Chloroflexota bacterium]
MRSKRSSGGWLWPLALVALGVLLLANNFLLISGFNVSALLPLILVIIGGVILIRGDLFAGGGGKNFGITRGAVENAALEISAGPVDVQAYSLQREARLIAGQYAPDARPELNVDGVSARLRMDRAATPFFSLTPWSVALARDLPWKLYISTHLGQVSADLADLIVEGGVIATGFGDIHVTTPVEALAPIHIRSTLGSIRVTVPPGHSARVVVRQTRQFSVNVDEARYTSPEPNVYVARDADPERPEATIYVNGTFGDAYLI